MAGISFGYNGYQENIPLKRFCFNLPLRLANAALVFALIFPTPLAADPLAAHPDRAAIGAAYDGINAAFAQHNIPRLMAYLTPDYGGVDEKGARFNRAQAQRQFAEQSGQIKTIQSRSVILGIAPAPGGTLVEMKMHAAGTGEKRILFAKLRATFTDYLWVRDLWVSTPQGCRLKYRQTLADEMKIHPR